MPNPAHKASLYPGATRPAKPASAVAGQASLVPPPVLPGVRPAVHRMPPPLVPDAFAGGSGALTEGLRSVTATAVEIPVEAAVMDLDQDLLNTLALDSAASLERDRRPTRLPGVKTRVLKVKLRLLEGPNAGQSFSLAEGGMGVFGRGKTVKFRVDDATVSRQHIKFEVRRGQLCFEDLGSNNGVAHNGKTAICGELQAGDLLRVGNSLLRIEVLDQRTLSPKPPLQTQLSSARQRFDRLQQGLRRCGPKGRASLCFLGALMVTFSLRVVIDEDALANARLERGAKAQAASLAAPTASDAVSTRSEVFSGASASTKGRRSHAQRLVAQAEALATRQRSLSMHETRFIQHVLRRYAKAAEPAAASLKAALGKQLMDQAQAYRDAGSETEACGTLLEALQYDRLSPRLHASLARCSH